MRVRFSTSAAPSAVLFAASALALLDGPGSAFAQVPAPSPPNSQGAAKPGRSEIPKGTPGGAEPDRAAPELLSLPPRPPGPGGTSPKRPRPSYGGLPEDRGAAEVLLWVPKVAFFPLYLTTEFALRRPLGLLVTTAERERWIQELKDIFTFGPRNNIGVVPTAVIDFGFRSSVGVYAFWDEFIAPENRIRLHAATGGTDWLRFTVADTIRTGRATEVTGRFEFWRRPDGAFHGIGPRARYEDRGRYGSDTVSPSLSLRFGIGRPLSAEIGTGLVAASFDGDTCCDDPSILVKLAQGAYPVPPGFEEGFVAARQTALVAIDTRRPRPAPGDGVRLELRGEHDVDVRGEGRPHWVRYGASAGAFADAGYERTLGITLAAEFAEPIVGEIPFSELPQPSGDGLMRGLREGRVRGPSALVALVEWRYPIWAFLDGSLQASVGNAFGRHLEDFELDLLRASFAFGFRTSGARDHAFNVLLGTGTETFEQGADFDEVRFLLGATRGF